jgi:hypothetical protein
MFIERTKGKIIITVERENARLNSNMMRRGLARQPDVALTTLLINFVSLALEQDKDPKAIVDSSLQELVEMVKSKRNPSG